MPDHTTKPLITAANIDGSQDTVVVPGDAIVTPAAYDRAASLGVTILRAKPDEAAEAKPTRPNGIAADDLAVRIEHTNLAPTATRYDIARLCEEAQSLGCVAVCVNPTHILAAGEACTGATTRICTVVGFPTGTHHTRVKMAEASRAVAEGAHEIDMVANHALLLDDHLGAYAADIHCVRKAVGDDVTLKVIIEASQLGDEDIIRAALIAEQSGACYIKTSTGVYGQARIEDVALLRRVLQSTTKIKAAGGITSLQFARELVAAGADRLGMSRTRDLIHPQEES